MSEGGSSANIADRPWHPPTLALITDRSPSRYRTLTTVGIDPFPRHPRSGEFGENLNPGDAVFRIQGLPADQNADLPFWVADGGSRARL